MDFRSSKFWWGLALGVCWIVVAVWGIWLGGALSSEDEMSFSRRSFAFGVTNAQQRLDGLRLCHRRRGGTYRGTFRLGPVANRVF